MALSTLHTNDAPQTIARLMNMGIAPISTWTSPEGRSLATLGMTFHHPAPGARLSFRA